eukprot:3046967-Lingulodinium_polyedra.AAC.1
MPLGSGWTLTATASCRAASASNAPSGVSPPKWSAYPHALAAAAASSAPSRWMRASCAQITSAPDSLRHLPAEPQL